MVKHVPPLAFIIMLGLPSTVHSQADTLRAAARDISGCYTVHLGNWDRPVGSDAAYYTPPDTVLLDSVLVAGLPGGPGLRLHPNMPALVRYHTFAPKWWRTGPDSVRLRWTSGFVGVSMRLGRAGRNLLGRAEAFSDARVVDLLPDGSQRPRPFPAARVELRRIPCR